MKTIIASYTLPSGNYLEIYEPESSGVEPMRRGTCPGCGEQLNGFAGRYGTIREVDRATKLVVSGSAYATSYGHLDCVRQLFTRHTVSNELRWVSGTQRQMIEFVQAYEGGIVLVRKVPGRPAAQRYDYRIQEMW